MSTIQSKFDDISKIRFEPLTAAVVAVVKLTRVDRTVVALGANGTVYTDGVSAHCYYHDGHEGKLSRVLDGCVKLRLLTAKAVEQHKAATKARSDKAHNEWAAESIIDNAKDLGLNLTAAQQAKLASYLPPAKVVS